LSKLSFTPSLVGIIEPVQKLGVIDKDNFGLLTLISSLFNQE
jgi:hypothetical protein